jgi:hypothetical protein
VIDEMAMNLRNSAARDSIRRTALEVTVSRVNELLTSVRVDKSTAKQKAAGATRFRHGKLIPAHQRVKG